MSKPILEGVFSFRGRRDRKSYFLLNLFSIFAIVAVLMVVALIDPSLATSDGDLSPIIVVVFGFCVFVYMIVYLLSSAQRARDFGWTGWAALLTLIPYVGTLAYFALFLVPGERGDNRYGRDPRY